MSSEREVTVRVATPVVGDSSRGRCRLHREVMDRLGLSPGDPVEIECGEASVAVSAHPAPDGSWNGHEANPAEVNVDLSWFLGRDADDFSGREVRVRPVSPSPASLVAYERLPPGTVPEHRSMVTKENLLGALTIAGTQMPVYREEASSTTGMTVAVVETDPDGVVVVTPETELEPRPPTPSD